MMLLRHYLNSAAIQFSRGLRAPFLLTLKFKIVKIVNVNGKIDVINETREESIETLNYYLEEKGIEPLTESELRDWDIRGGETNAQLYEWAMDLVNDLHTEKCESKQVLNN